MTVVRADTFTRANVASGWGTATDGNTWTVQTGNGESVSSNEGLISGSTASSWVTLGASLSGGDAEGLVRWSTANTASTAGIVLRFTDTNNYYLARYDGAGHIAFYKKVAGTTTNPVGQYAFTLTTGTFYWMRFRVQGSSISIRTWQDGSSEPSTWNYTTTDTSLAGTGGSANKVGLYGYGYAPGNKYDTFSVDDLASTGGTTYNQTVSDATSALDIRASQTQRPVIDPFSELDTWSKSALRPLLEGTSALDGTQKGAQKPILGAFSALDGLNKATQRPLLDAQSATDVLSHLWSAHLTLSEAISALDAPQKHVLRSILNATSATDTLTESNQLLAGQNWRQTLSDAFSSTDALVSWTLVKLLGDAYAATDTVARGVMRPLYDGSSATDTLSRKVLAYLVDQGAFSDQVARQLQRTLSETTSALDRVSVGRVLLLQLLDAFSLTDTPLASYTKAQFGLMRLATTLVANALQMQITLTTTAQLAAQATLLASPLALNVQMLATALNLVPTLLVSPLVMSLTTPW